MKTKALLLILIISLAPLAPVVNMPHRLPTVIVSMDNDDQAVQTAIHTIVRNTPNTIVTTFDSHQFNSLIRQRVKVVIWVAHGSEEGFLINDQIKPWQNLVQWIKTTPSKDITLMCDSSTIMELSDLSRNDVMTFTNDIDAVLGGLFVSWALTQVSSLFDKISLRLHKLVTGTTNAHSLGYVMGRMSGDELSFAIVMTGVTLSLVLLDLYLDPEWSFVKKTGAKMIAMGQVGVITTLVYLAQGSISKWEAFATLSGFVLDFVDALVGVMKSATWWEKAAFGVSAFLSILALAIETASDGTITYAKYLAAFGSIIGLAADIAGDYNDWNTWVG